MAGRGPSTTPRGRSCRDGGAASRGPRTVDAHSACQKIRTGQDALLARKGLSSAEAGPSWSLYCVCAGHGGVEAANYVRDGLWRELRALLPRQAMPEREGDGGWRLKYGNARSPGPRGPPMGLQYLLHQGRSSKAWIERIEKVHCWWFFVLFHEF
ncbi:unnamed protein product [Ostreobium quekettii]|uniref:Uncharacterized protein n=1 Tax=Ostreobium quekettii TaxID=121088 RepID=A0A8S1J5T1_9CHLO|nr:unnamed protein product [Ostreobium quekettii]